jgi:hypothetical protein
MSLLLLFRRRVRAIVASLTNTASGPVRVAPMYASPVTLAPMVAGPVFLTPSVASPVTLEPIP